jgi:hypothetical protein
MMPFLKIAKKTSDLKPVIEKYQKWKASQPPENITKPPPLTNEA